MTDELVLEGVGTSRLLQLHTEVLAELRARNIVRSANNPTGDYAELLFARAMGWSLNNKSSADADAIDGNGNRYQIKSRRLTKENASRQLGFMRRIPERPFDYLAATLFDERFSVFKAAIIPIERVADECKFVTSVNAWRFMLRDHVWGWAGVVDVTQQLRAAQATL